MDHLLNIILKKFLLAIIPLNHSKKSITIQWLQILYFLPSTICSNINAFNRWRVQIPTFSNKLIYPTNCVIQNQPMSISDCYKWTFLERALEFFGIISVKIRWRMRQRNGVNRNEGARQRSRPKSTNPSPIILWIYICPNPWNKLCFKLWTWTWGITILLSHGCGYYVGKQRGGLRGKPLERRWTKWKKKKCIHGQCMCWLWTFLFVTNCFNQFPWSSF